ncbi:MAG: type I-E CRISPR-associated protein Cas5/CasD [Nitrospiria bacterium]
MKAYLIFQLYGPMASWGDIAVGENRPGFLHPSKSAIMGLVAAALGVSRDQEATHRRLAEGYGFAVRIDCAGTPLSDYHTAQVPPSGTGRNKIRFATRRDELETLPREKLKTILSKRGYRADAFATIALWARTSPPYSLASVAEALKHPAYTLYLGRKSCPLALPVAPQLMEAVTIREALSKAVFGDFEGLYPLLRLRSSRPALYWDPDGVSGIPAEQTFERRDLPLSRKRWQFDIRQERHANLGRED